MPSSRTNHRYLPRRLMAVNWRPVRVASKTLASSEPPVGRNPRTSTTSTRSTAEGMTRLSSPARTVSTSGSSGTGAGRDQCGNRKLGRSLLGLLLVVAGVGSVQLSTHFCPGTVAAIVVRARSDDVVSRSLKPLLRAVLLENCLPVGTGSGSIRLVNEGIEEMMDEAQGV